MDLADLFYDIRQHASEFATLYCVVNGEVIRLDDIQNMGYDEFSLRSKINMPLQLYRYYPDKTLIEQDTNKKINYSIQALVNNTVYLQTPTAFDDIYDSDINIEYSVYEHLRLVEYCHRCGLNIHADQHTQEIGDLLVQRLWEHYVNNGNLEHVFTKSPDSEIENLSNKYFTLKILSEFYKSNDFGKAIAVALQDEYRIYISRLQTTFRTTCFATTPYSQLMWGGAYADCHRGFCIEYTVLPCEKNYDEIYYNLFPMIYCKVRPEMSSRLVANQDKVPSKEVLWDIYSHGVLRKSIDWAFQNEWRLVLPLHSNNISDYNVKFYPITKVFLGNRMPPERRRKIIDICKRKGIPYIGVRRNPSVFEMEPCDILCEDCSKLIDVQVRATESKK